MISMLVNLDLHIHSRYSMAVSADMNLPEIAREAARKGVKIVATGDCLHPRWLESIKELAESDGFYCLGETCFVLSVEVEDSSRVHHLIFLPETSKAEELAESFAPHCTSLSSDGRPKLHLAAPEVADLALEAGGMVGPSHAFTPWTGMYAYFSSLAECYQEKAESIHFIELGLSADTDYADRIAELSSRTFLSNSDAHSPRCNKLAREFNRMELAELSYNELCLTICRKEGRRVKQNVGFFPAEGKYNRTACTRCYRQFSQTEKDKLMGRCPSCGGRIKLGVWDRINLLADYEKPVHPDHRPPYLHIIPLAEIAALALGYRSTTAAAVQRCWSELIEGRTEIEVLMEADLSELSGDPRVLEAIEMFRQGKVKVVPGGGGKYGEVKMAGGAAGKEEKKEQKSLFDF
jgi:uncharacterized protein (TIGR00375 family)